MADDILIVDDERDIRSFYITLEDEDYSTLQAATANEAEPCFWPNHLNWPFGIGCATPTWTALKC